MFGAIRAGTVSSSFVPFHSLPAAVPRHAGVRGRPRCPQASAQAVSAPPGVMEVLQASELDAAQLRAATARPRIDFASILKTVRGWCAWGRCGGEVEMGGLRGRPLRQVSWRCRHRPAGPGPMLGASQPTPPSLPGGAHHRGCARTWRRGGARVHPEVRPRQPCGGVHPHRGVPRGWSFRVEWRGRGPVSGSLLSGWRRGSESVTC